MTSASSTAFFTASIAWSRLMMLPRRVPFIGDVPLPMISSCPRSLISPTSAQTFEVPMSSATTYFSSVLGMMPPPSRVIPSGARDLGGWERAALRHPPGSLAHARDDIADFHNDPIRKTQIGVFDAWLVLGAEDRVEAAPFRGDVVRIGVNERAELAIETREAARRDSPHRGDARVDLAIVRAQLGRQRDRGRGLGAARVGDDRQIVVAGGGREVRERDAGFVGVAERAVDAHERNRRALGDFDAQRVRQLLLDVDVADPADAAEVALHAGDVDLKEIDADVALRDAVNGRPRRVHFAGDLDVLDREARVGLRVLPDPDAAGDDDRQHRDIAQQHEQTPDLNLPLIAAQARDVGRTEEADVDAAHRASSRTSCSATWCTSPAPMVMKMSFGLRRRRISLTSCALLRSMNSMPGSASAMMRAEMPSTGCSRAA